MAHRGRLNVLANFLKKSLEVIFTEFCGQLCARARRGRRRCEVSPWLSHDSQARVGRRGGDSSFRQSESSRGGRSGGGRDGARPAAHSRQDTEHRRKVLPLLIHGDAAFAGQGIVAETLNMSQLHGYSTGGTVHVIVNNQIGFTTLPEDARSSTLRDRCREDDRGANLPREWRRSDRGPLCRRDWRSIFARQFKRDVVIDMYCYRRYGHNEGGRTALHSARCFTEDREAPVGRAALQTGTDRVRRADCRTTRLP